MDSTHKVKSPNREGCEGLALGMEYGKTWGIYIPFGKALGVFLV